MKKVISLFLVMIMLFSCAFAQEVAPETQLEIAETTEPAAEQPTEETAEEPAEETAEEPAEETAEEPAEETAEEPAEETAEEPAEETAEEPVEETAEQPAEETTEEPAEEIAEEPAEETTEQPAEELVHFAAGYVLIKSGTAIRAGKGGSVLGTITAASYAYAVLAEEAENPADDWLQVGFAAAGEVVTGYVRFSAVEAAENAQISASGLTWKGMALAEASYEAAAAEEPAEEAVPAEESTEEPAEEAAPAEESTEEPAEEAAPAEETAEEPAEEAAPAEETAEEPAEEAAPAEESTEEAAIPVDLLTSAHTNTNVLTVEPVTAPLLEITEIIIPKKLTMGWGEEVILPLEVEPAGAWEELTYKSSKTSVMTVKDGVLTGVHRGTAKLTVKTESGVSATCTVTVLNAPSKITLNKTSLVLGEGQEYDLTATLVGGSYNYVWESTDPGVADVDDYGHVTAIGVGTAAISYTAFNGKTAYCNVTVNSAPTEIFTEIEDDIEISRSQNVKIGAYLDESETGTFEYVSDSENAVVSKDGVITGKAYGEAWITISTYNGVTKDIHVTVKAAPTAIKMTSSVTIGVGESILLVPTVTPDDCAVTLGWGSTVTRIAVVDQDGWVTGVAAGSTKVTVATQNGKKATCKVYVKKEPTSITLSSEELTMNLGTEQKLTATFSSGAYSNLIWTSDDESVVIVDNGKLTPVSVGTAIVTAETYNGLTASCFVTVWEKPAVVTLDESELTMAVGQERRLVANIIGEDGNPCECSCTWKSSNVKIATVTSHGLINAKRTGNVTITVTTYNGLKATCTLKVVAAPTKVSLPYFVMLGLGESHDLTPILTPSNSITEFTWTSSNEDAVYVDEGGSLYAADYGNSTVTVRTSNGRTAVAAVKVVDAPDEILLTSHEETIFLYDSVLLTAELPEGSSSYITWVSDNEDVAIVDEYGEVYGVGYGSACITAYTYNGLYDECLINVEEEPVKLVLSDTTMYLSKGLSDQLLVTGYLADGTEWTGNITWYSSSTKVCTVDEYGEVTAIGSSGSCTITAMADNGLKATCKVYLRPVPTSISLNLSNVYLGVGDEVMLFETVLPSNTVTELVWMSDAEDVATVDEYGNVTAVSEGVASIYVGTHNGLWAYCDVTVVSDPLEMEICGASELQKGSQYQLSAYIDDDDVTYAVEWSSMDTKVATITSTGKVKGINVGETVIMAVYNGGEAIATFDVHVHGILPKIEITSCIAEGENVTKRSLTLLNNGTSTIASVGTVITEDAEDVSYNRVWKNAKSSSYKITAGKSTMLTFSTKTATRIQADTKASLAFTYNGRSYLAVFTVSDPNSGYYYDTGDSSGTLYSFDGLIY